MSAPTSLTELRDAILDQPGSIRIAGAGTAADWAGTPDEADVVVDTTGLSGVVSHNPGDMTVEVRAGTPLRALQEVLAEHGQRVAFDAARVPRGATVGGLFATADAGPLATTYGSLRDLVIGATLVLADGTAARSGGHVIKNVAGYDLTKLVHGAHGTLAAIAELVLRLHPVPAVTTTVAVPVPLGELPAAAKPVIDGQVEPTAIQWVDGRLLVRLEGSAGGVDGRAAAVRSALSAVSSDAARLSDADAEAAWRSHAEAVDRRVSTSGDGAVLRLGVAPVRLLPTLDAIGAEVGGLAWVTAAPALGTATITVPATVEAVSAAHACVAAAGGTSTLRGRPAGVELPAFGPAPASVGLLRAVAAAFDPEQRFGRGRLAPWLPTPSRSAPPSVQAMRHR